jgi:hypothetical protein
MYRSLDANPIFETLACSERRYGHRRDLDRRARLWVATHARLTIARAESPETGDRESRPASSSTAMIPFPDSVEKIESSTSPAFAFVSPV